MDLSRIYEPVQDGLNEVENRLALVSKVDFAHLAELLSHSLKGGGKRIRPALVLLSGRLFGDISESLLNMAMASELFHLATLVHDDAIDNADVRHWRPTVNKIWGLEKAVLLGDYLFANASALICLTGNVRVISLFSQTLMTISSGEIGQAFNAFNLGQTFDDYLWRISRKTAALFSMTTESGSVLSGAPEEAVQALKEYSYNFGVGFQIVDDIFDFTVTEEQMGKPVGSDLAQGTLTLPSMLLLERYPEDNPVKRMFQTKGQQDEQEKQQDIQRATEMVRNSSIVQDCYKVASEYCAKAAEKMAELPDTPARRSLTELANFVVERSR
ncbi:polyprenyl synthetase family protein [Chloroflexota bacterium]